MTIDNFTYIKISDRRELLDQAAMWFHTKWGIPCSAYKESMESSFSEGTIVPAWYLCIKENQIIGGMGVIANDFHNRIDLTPNVCAVYTEENYRLLGIAGKLLQFVCDDMKNQGIDILYLLTDHIGFYERYGWEFFCMVQGDEENRMSRMYIHKQSE